jgi:hypothetical protein
MTGQQISGQKSQYVDAHIAQQEIERFRASLEELQIPSKIDETGGTVYTVKPGLEITVSRDNRFMSYIDSSNGVTHGGTAGPDSILGNNTARGTREMIEALTRSLPTHPVGTVPDLSSELDRERQQIRRALGIGQSVQKIVDSSDLGFGRGADAFVERRDGTRGITVSLSDGVKANVYENGDIELYRHKVERNADGYADVTMEPVRLQGQYLREVGSKIREISNTPERSQ